VPQPYENQEKDKLLTQLSDKLETLDPKSPMTMFMKAQVLEQLASVKKSNPILERAIHLYKEVLYSNIEDDLIQKAATSCVKLMQFRGWSGQAAQIWQILIQRFPQNFEYKRQLGVTYLTIGKDESAKKSF